MAPLGCLPLQQVPESSNDRRAAPAAPKKVVAGGSCLVLGEMEKAAFPPETFLRKVNDLVMAERYESARRFIHRYPDLAQQAVRQAANADANNPALLIIARVHDQQCGSSIPAEGWLALLQDRAAHPDRYAAYDAARRHFVELLGEGKTEQATQVPLVKHAPKGLLQIDAYERLGEASLMTDKPQEAVAPLTKALTLAQNANPYQAAQVMLLLGEAQRRSGKKAEGTGTWQQAVLLAGELIKRPSPVLDPILWERASYLRPAQSSWPEPVIKQLIPPGSQGRPRAPAELGKPGLDEAWLWAHIGRWHLDRGEAQSALVACKRAESLHLDPHFQQQMQLLQARALIQLQQREVVLGLLGRLAGEPNSAAAPPALAMLGSLKLMEGDPQQNLPVLKKAVEESASPSWPGRAEAEADLGLAYLMTGNEAEGLHWLHAGQQHFDSEHDHELLVLSLDNEARYFTQTNRPEEAARVRKRMKMLEKTAL